MIKLSIYLPPLPPELERSVAELDKLCFRNHFTPTDKQHTDRHDRFCSSGDLVYYVLATQNNQLIGETRVFKRIIAFDSQKVVLGGIGSVATHPKKRKQGIATQMVAKGMELLVGEHCDVAYLCADIYTLKSLEFYEQFGFRRLLQKHMYVGKSGTRYTDLDGMIAPVGSKKLFEKIIAAATPFEIGVGNW
jgi:predicted acetyltransferase